MLWKRMKGWARVVALGTLALAAACEDGALPETQGVARVEVSPGTRTLRSGEVYRFSATPRGHDGAAVAEPVEWATSDDAVAGVDAAGNVAARAAGSAVITARSGGRIGRATVTVEAPAVATVEIAPASPLVLGVGATQQLTAVVRAADGTILAGRAVLWSTADSAVARLSPSGLAEGRAEGEAVVRATVEGRTAFAAIRVTMSRSPTLPVASVQVDAPRGTVEPGETMTMHATVRAATGVALERAVAWSSSNPAVATVDSAGRFRAVAPGVARIRAEVEGKTGYQDVWVVRWESRALVEVNGGPLPGLLFETRSTDGASVNRLVAHEGVLRTMDGMGMGYFELRFNTWFTPQNGPGTQAGYTVRGTVQRDPSTGVVAYHPEAGAPFAPAVRADGKTEILVRFPGSLAETRLLFAAP